MEPDIVFEAHGSYVIGLHFTRDGDTLVSCGMDGLVKFWDSGSWEAHTVLKGHANSVNSLALSPDEKLLATSSSDHSVRLWSFPGGKPLHTLYDQKKVASGVAFSPDGAWVASIYYGGRLALWDREGNQLQAVKASPGNLACLAFSPDGRMLATGGLGSEALVFSIPDLLEVQRLPGHEDAVMAARFTQEGAALVTMSYRGVVRFWDTSRWQESGRWEIPGARGFTFTPGEKYAAVSVQSGVQIRSLKDGKLQNELTVGTKVVNGLSFSPDGRLLAVGAADRKIRIYRL